MAQEITIFGQRSLWHANNLCDIKYTGCDWRLLNQGSMLGYAYHPSGSLWLVMDELYGIPGNQQNRIKIFDVDIDSCKYKLLYTIPLPKNWWCPGAVNIDYLGRMYITTVEYDTISHKQIGTISRIDNPAIPIIQRVFVIFPQQRFFEIHFAKDRIYMVEMDKPYIRVFDNNFVLLDTIIMQKHIWGLTSFSYGCDSVKTYATHMSISTEEFVNTHPDTIMYISEYNFETNTLTPVCSYNMGIHAANTQLTSPLEFLSSDPECDLLIDLDRDNSTGVYPYDYIDSTIYCGTAQIPVCDYDVYIHTSGPLDSIRCVLSGIREPGTESLIMTGSPPGVNFIKRDDSTYVIIAAAGSDDLYRKAMLALRYEHNGQHRTSGERRVIVQGFNAIKFGVKITARLQISSLPYAGEDAMLMICEDTIIQGLSALTGGQPFGYWWPSLASGSDVYNATTDIKNHYFYIVSDPVCGNDTAMVTIVRDTTAPADILGADRVLCSGDSIIVSVAQGGVDINWDDGSSNASRIITSPGLYWLSVKTSGGCLFRDTLQVEAGKIWDPIIKTINPVCGLANGRIEIDSLDYLQGSNLLINNVQLTKYYKSNLSQGNYNVASISLDGCITNSQVDLINEPSIAIEMDTLFFIQQYSWQIIDYAELNGVNVSGILFNPDNSIRWNGTLIEAYGDQDRTYVVTFIDKNGCFDLHKLNIKIEKIDGIYLPNIFRPHSSGGNDKWNVVLSNNYELQFLRIYDRWGNVVYDSMTEALWDGSFNGRECATGVYVYQLVVIRIGDRERIVMKGDLTLVK